MPGTYEAVPNSTDLLVSLLLKILDGFLDNGINGLESVRVLAIATLGQPVESFCISKWLLNMIKDYQDPHKRNSKDP